MSGKVANFPVKPGIADDPKIPNAIPVEQAVLASILIEPAIGFPIVESVLRPEHFFRASNGEIYQAMLDVAAAGLALDYQTLSDRLASQRKLEQVGGVTYLSWLIDTHAYVWNLDSYCRILVDKYNQRQVMQLCQNVTSELMAGVENSAALLAEMSERVTEFQLSLGQKKSRNVSALLDEFFETLEERMANPGDFDGYRVGLGYLDHLIGGLQPADLIYLGARPSQGKTALAVKFAREVAEQAGKPVPFFSMEMADRMLAYRMLAAESRVPLTHIVKRMMNVQEVADTMDARWRLQKAPVEFFYRSETAQTIRAECLRLKAKHGGVGMVVVDYLQLMRHENGNLSLYEQVTENSRALKLLAIELECPVLCLSQLSRPPKGSNPRPTMADLKQSGGTEQDADIVLLLHTPEEDKVDVRDVEIILDKHRNGPTGVVNAKFFRAYQFFAEVAEGGY